MGQLKLVHFLSEISMHYLIPLFFGLLFIPSLGQELPKDTLYFDFYKETWPCTHDNIRFVIERDTTTQFNLCGKIIFIYDRENPIDTLNKSQFETLKIVKSDSINSLRKEWFIKNDSILKAKYPAGSYPPIPNQFIFKPFVVVSTSQDCYMVYPVRWKFVW